MGNIAIIPARSGSKGLKDKNIKPLLGKPLLAYSIEAAQKSGIFDCIHVSTDSEAYAEIAREYGAEVPFLRSGRLSSDTATSWDTMRFVLENYNKEYEMATLLQPTSPLRNPQDILTSFQIFGENHADAVISVCETDHSPLWCNTLPRDGCMNGFLDKASNISRQNLPQYYRINGAIYMMKTSLLYQENMPLYGEKTYAYLMPKSRSVDIDDEIDFIVAEAIMKKRI